MGFETDSVEKVQKIASLIKISEKCLTKIVIDKQRV